MRIYFLFVPCGSTVVRLLGLVEIRDEFGVIGQSGSSRFGQALDISSRVALSAELESPGPGSCLFFPVDIFSRALVAQQVTEHTRAAPA